MALRLYGNWEGWLKTRSLSWVRNAAIFIHSHIRRQSTTWYHCGWQKESTERRFSQRGSSITAGARALSYRDARWRTTPNSYPTQQGVTLFCLVNRIFVHPCACVAIRCDPRVADGRASQCTSQISSRVLGSRCDFYLFSVYALIISSSSL